MANNATLARSGIPEVSGGLLSGPVIRDMTADGPTDYAEASAEMSFLGYIGEDGVTESNSRDTNKIKAWGGDVVRVVQNEHSITYKFAMLESANAAALKLFYGPENVAVDGTTRAITVRKNAKILPHTALYMAIRDGDYIISNLVGDGQVVETGDVVYVHSDVIRYEVTVEAFADRNGDKAIMKMIPPTVTTP